MISAFANSLKIPELRQRIFFTLLVVVIARLGANIPLPGIDVAVREGMVQQMMEKTADSKGLAAVMALMNVFSGGALQNSALFALGVMPYISASIMMQLLTAVLPQLGRLAREDGGRQKINMYTRYVTIVLCLFQGWFMANSLINIEANPLFQGMADTMTKPLVPDSGPAFVFSTIMMLTAGTMFLMWLGDQITERGIGNGVSIIITVNIIFALPGALVQLYKTYVEGAQAEPLKPLMLVALIVFIFVVIAAVIAITQAQRRVSIHYAKRVVGRKMYGGQTQYMPLKVNYAGVMPIIFANAILVFPAQIIMYIWPGNPTATQISSMLSGATWVNYSITALMIFFFSYFWVATMFQPNQIADDLKKNGGYIPGVRPGRPTAEFLDFTMSRLTFAGAIFLTAVAVLPGILQAWMKVPAVPAQLFGGTSLLIMVGVVLDVMRQVETHLIQRHYDGFLRKGKIRGRFDRPGATGAAASSGSVIWLFVIAAILIIAGVTAFLISQSQ